VDAKGPPDILRAMWVLEFALKTGEFFVVAFASLFAIVSPLSGVPAFLAMTPHDTPAERCRMARTACLTAAAVLVFFGITGQAIFRFLGVSMPAFQIAGGAFLFLIALDLLRAKDDDGKITPEEKRFAETKRDIAITPLAVPLIAGPGSISTTILLRAEAPGTAGLLALIAAIAAVLVTAYWIFKYGARGAGWLSPVVLRVTSRLMGLILGALAVQFVLNGLAGAGFPAK
jgi:multiple antibiotic resistance protein